MMLWSVPFWFFFEALNLRIQNWWYVFVLRSPVADAADSLLAFATVLPACLLHADLAEALGWGRGARGRPQRIPGKLGLALSAGALSLALPLLAPRWAFPLVWFVPLALAEAVNSQSGAPSLLSDFERGSYERIARLASGGLWAGGVWELFNFWARSKWLYTVPGFERWRLFEMPIPGFLGFPALALSAFSFYAMVSSWRRDGGSPSPRVYAAAAVAGAILSVGTLVFVLQRTVISRRPLLSELSALDDASIQRLRSAGLPTPELLERKVRDRGTSEVARASGIDPDRLARAAKEAALAVHKGMGVPVARLCERSGVPSLADLSRADPLELTHRMRAVAGPGDRVPSEALVRLWVLSARPDGVPRR